VISRVVEQVRDTTGSVGSSGSGLMPGRRDEGMSGGDDDSGPNDEF
jgi:hypothetical protein